MSYFVYENWTHDRACIHRGVCGYCNYGSGRMRADSGRHGRWLGPFDEPELALKVAKSLGRGDTTACSTCKP